MTKCYKCSAIEGRAIAFRSKDNLVKVWCLKCLQNYIFELSDKENEM